jgi:UDP-N-acetylmuramoylalanine--D-glutamate ligase
VVRDADGWLDGATLVLDGEALMAADEVALVGRHNLANALAAVLAADAMGVDRASLAATLRTFQGLDHRHREVWEHDGVRWIDDSKATNVGATVAGLGGYPDGSVHLILGGQAKGQDFSSLRDEVARAARRVYVIGVDGPVIAAAMEGVAPIERCGDLAEAVRRARRLAEAGEWVLLAPACASFDQFSGYAERGDRFAELARGQEVAPCR